jgi:hypothetical protein
MKTAKKKPKTLSPGAERLRRYLRWLYRPRDQENVAEPK